MSRVLPILFNTDMVRAILDGRKMVTRRVIRPQPKMRLCYTYVSGRKSDIGKWRYPDSNAWISWGKEYKRPYGIEFAEEDEEKRWTPPCHTGDILYVRETYCPNYFDVHIAGYRSGDNMRGNRNAYKADYHKEIIGDVVPEPKWKPSIHMPKEAARIWLKVTDVRVERLQDIDEEQAEKEGGINNIGFIHSSENEYENLHTAREDFKENIWNSTIKKSDLYRYGWDDNPWVWVIGFERCEKPKEAYGQKTT